MVYKHMCRGPYARELEEDQGCSFDAVEYAQPYSPSRKHFDNSYEVKLNSRCKNPVSSHLPQIRYISYFDCSSIQN